MQDAGSARRAQWLALCTPAALLGGAYFFELIVGLYPCEMCWWQRWPHFAALGLALLSFAAPFRRVWVALAALAVLVSGAIGAFHAGVEYDWWEGITACAAFAPTEGVSALDAIMATPMIRCDEAQWDLLGVSLAGWNFLFSTAAGLAILALLARRDRT